MFDVLVIQRKWADSIPALLKLEQNVNVIRIVPDGSMRFGATVHESSYLLLDGSQVLAADLVGGGERG